MDGEERAVASLSARGPSVREVLCYPAGAAPLTGWG